MIRSFATIALSAFLLTGCAGGSRDFPLDRIDRALAGAPGEAQPSKIVAAELGFARAAQDSGQWTAFRDYAADGAVMFAPGPVVARDWLKNQANPPQAVKWQPHQVWMSCDGSMAVSKGAWQAPDGTFGYFTTVWGRQKDGQYKWVLDQGDTLAEPLEEPDFIRTLVADCPTAGARADAVAGSIVSLVGGDMPAGGEFSNQTSQDNSLFLNFVTEENNARHFRLLLWMDGEMREVMRGDVAAPAGTE